MTGVFAALGWTEVGVLAAIGTVAVTAAGLFMTIRGIRHQLWLHTFSEYTRRYADVVRDLPSEGPPSRQRVRY